MTFPVEGHLVTMDNKISAVTHRKYESHLYFFNFSWSPICCNFSSGETREKLTSVCGPPSRTSRRKEGGRRRRSWRWSRRQKTAHFCLLPPQILPSWEKFSGRYDVVWPASKWKRPQVDSPPPPPLSPLPPPLFVSEPKHGGTLESAACLCYS